MTDTDDEMFIPLMILTESPREAASVDDDIAADLVVFCLGLGSDHWASRAMDWVEHGVTGPAVTEALTTAGGLNDLSQGVRHRGWERVKPRP